MEKGYSPNTSRYSTGMSVAPCGYLRSTFSPSTSRDRAPDAPLAPALLVILWRSTFRSTISSHVFVPKASD